MKTKQETIDYLEALLHLIKTEKIRPIMLNASWEREKDKGIEETIVRHTDIGEIKVQFKINQSKLNR